MAPPFRRIGIAGLGLIGGSIARDLRARRPEVELIGVDVPGVLELAHEAGVIDERATSVAAVSGADLVILAAPVPAIAELAGELATSGFSGLVTDVGSTKRHVLAAAAEAGLTRFVGGHPMAGSERGGFVSSRAGLFEGRPWFVVAPDSGAIGADVAAIEDLARTLGAVPVTTDALTHDRTVAHLSHLPQLVAVALMNTAAAACGEAGLQHAGRAFGEMTRLARSPADIWQGILESNRDCIAEAARDLIGRLERLVAADARTLESAFQSADESSPTHGAAGL
jgi:prephenate dehydrogenase